jgi:3-oxoadipate enol-lactonase
MPFETIDQCRLHYLCDGPADAPPLVLSHSLGADLSMWDPQIAPFSRPYRVCRYDTRGHGASTVTPGPYTIARLGLDVLGLLDALGMARVNFCGLSLGGMIGMWLGTHAPDRIDKLVLCNTAARLGSSEMWNNRIAAVGEGGMSALVPAVIERWFTASFRERAPERVDPLRRTLLATPVEGYAACCGAIRDMDQRETICAVCAPTLVIAGTHDPATSPAEGRLIAASIPGARHVELDAAHLSNIEAADRFTAVVLDFLSEVVRRSPDE